MKPARVSGVSAVFLIAIAGCGGKVVFEGPPSGATSGGGEGGSGGGASLATGSTNTVGATSTSASTGGFTSCQQCACETFVANAGCADLCDGDLNGSGIPNFCNGVPALPQCQTCITKSCEDPDLCP